MIRTLVAGSIAILVTGCAHQDAPINYAARADWNDRAIARPQASLDHVQRRTAQVKAVKKSPESEDPSVTASIDRSSSLWTLELSAEQDPENQRLKRLIQICHDC